MFQSRVPVSVLLSGARGRASRCARRARVATRRVGRIWPGRRAARARALVTHAVHVLRPVVAATAVVATAAAVAVLVIAAAVVIVVVDVIVAVAVVIVVVRSAVAARVVVLRVPAQTARVAVRLAAALGFALVRLFVTMREHVTVPMGR